MQKCITVDIYCRVSTQEQATEGYSLGEQEERLRKYADAHGWLVNAAHVDGGHSGGNMNRPALQAIIRDAEAHRIDKVLVYKLDRLSRSQKDTLYLIEDVFIGNGIDFVSMSETLDTSTAFGKAMIGILAVFAQLERETIKERMTLGRDAAVKAGTFHGGRPPIGYRYVDGELTVHDFDAACVRTIFEKYIAGMNGNQISTYMMEHYPTKDHIWTRRIVMGVLTQPLYAGNMLYKGELIPCAEVAPIITQDMWKTAQERWGREHTVRKQSAHESSFLLGGILWCGECGSRVYGNNVARGRYRYYACTWRHRNRRSRAEDQCTCTSSLWNADEIDANVIEQLRKLSLDRSALNANADDGHEREAEAARKRIEELDTQLDRLVDLFATGAISTAAINRRAMAVQKEKDALTRTLEELEKLKEKKIDTERAAAALDTFDRIIETATTAQLRAVIKTLIQSITLHKDTIVISWNL